MRQVLNAVIVVPTCAVSYARVAKWFFTLFYDKAFFPIVLTAKKLLKVVSAKTKVAASTSHPEPASTTVEAPFFFTVLATSEALYRSTLLMADCIGNRNSDKSAFQALEISLECSYDLSRLRKLPHFLPD